MRFDAVIWLRDGLPAEEGVALLRDFGLPLRSRNVAPTSVSRRPGLGYLSVGATFLTATQLAFGGDERARAPRGN